MSYQPYYNDEPGFEEWVKTHSFGIVINSSPGKLDPNYVKAHRPNCNSIQRHVGATTVYSKHCFDSVTEAIEHLESKSIQKPTFGCKACKVSALEPTSDDSILQANAQVLIAEGFNTPPVGNPTPRRIASAPSTLVQRDPAVVAWVLRQANGKCECCSMDAPFLTASGKPYLEVHHLHTLANGGPDTVDNTVALCPNCHRAVHHSASRTELIDVIYARVERLVRSQSARV